MDEGEGGVRSMYSFSDDWWERRLTTSNENVSAARAVAGLASKLDRNNVTPYSTSLMFAVFFNRHS